MKRNYEIYMFGTHHDQDSKSFRFNHIKNRRGHIADHLWEWVRYDIDEFVECEEEIALLAFEKAVNMAQENNYTYPIILSYTNEDGEEIIVRKAETNLNDKYEIIKKN